MAFILFFSLFVLFIVGNVGNEKRVETPVSCTNGPDKAIVPFDADTNGGTDVDVDAMNFILKYEFCTSAFFNEQINLETALSYNAISHTAEQCLEGEGCIPIRDEERMEELKLLRGRINIQQSSFVFKSVEAHSFTIEGERTLVMDIEGIEGYPKGKSFSNPFDYTVEFDDNGKVTKVSLNFHGLGHLLEEWGYNQLAQYGFAKPNPNVNVDNNLNNFHHNVPLNECYINIGAESIFYVCVVVALLILSTTICTVSKWKYKYDHQVVTYSKVNPNSLSDIN